MYADELTIESYSERSTNVIQLHLGGCINAVTYEKLENAVFRAFDTGQYNVDLYLADVEYMTSVGAGVLVNAHCEAIRNNGQLLLVEPSHHVFEVLDLLALSKILLFYRSELALPRLRVAS